MDALLTTDYTLLAADYTQTRQIAQECAAPHWGKNADGDVLIQPRYNEMNPMLGKCPSKSRVNAYFGASALVIYELSETLDPRYRKAFLIGAGVWEGYWVGHNLRLGIHIGF